MVWYHKGLGSIVTKEETSEKRQDEQVTLKLKLRRNHYLIEESLFSH